MLVFEVEIAISLNKKTKIPQLITFQSTQTDILCKNYLYLFGWKNIYISSECIYFFSEWSWGIADWRSVLVLISALGLSILACSIDFYALGMIEEQGTWINCEWNPVDFDRSFFTCEQLLQRQKGRNVWWKIDSLCPNKGKLFGSAEYLTTLYTVFNEPFRGYLSWAIEFEQNWGTVLTSFD